MDSILDLPNEVLFYICSYLPKVDIVVLSQVNQKFNEICCYKSVVRNLNFKDAHGITESMLEKFFLLKCRCDNISILNLNYCHWLPAEFFFRFPNLSNLKELHILNCQVGFTKLKEFASTLDLRALSWTWPDDNVRRYNSNSFADFVDKFSGLKQLVLHISSPYSTMELYYFLNCCPNLESFELFLVNSFKKSDDRIVVGFPVFDFLTTTQANPVKQLKHLKVVPLTPYARLILESFANPGTVWDTLWIYGDILQNWWRMEKLTLLQITSANVLHMSYSLLPSVFGPNQERNFIENTWNINKQMQCRELSLNNSVIKAKLLNAVAHQCLNLEKLSMANSTWLADEDCNMGLINTALKLLVDNCIKITHLDMTGANGECIDISCLTSLKNLVSLGISPIMLLKMKLAERRELDCGSQTRVSTSLPEETLRETVLWAITEACPNITKLQILIQAKSSSTHTVTEAEYACISRFKNLTHLRIHDFNYKGNGRFLTEVLKNCSGLVSLRIKELGSGCKYVNELSSALIHAKSLQNLSVWQWYLNLPAIFFENLGKCNLLMRVELSHLESHPGLSMHIKSLVSKLPKLVILYLWMAASNCESDDLDIALKEFRNDRPSFTHVICTSTTKNDPSVIQPLHIFLDGFQEFE